MQFRLASGPYVSIFLLVLSACFAASASTGKAKPNVLVILIDQLRFDHFSEALTPNLWALAERGANFRRAYASVPICPAARASLLTGLSPWRHGLRGYGSIARKYKLELPSYFKRRGYRTLSVGKQHFGSSAGKPLKHEYERMERYEGLPDEKDEYLAWFQGQRPGEDPMKSGNITCRRKEPGHGVAKPHFDWCWNSWLATHYEYPEELHPTTWTGDRAVNFLKDDQGNANSEPWFMSVSFHRPHSPYDPPSRFLHRVRDLAAAGRLPPGPARGSWDEKYRRCKEQGTGTAWCGEIPSRDAEFTRLAYKAAVMHVDEQVGRVLKEVNKSNTWIVFTSDHGDMQMDHFMWRKSVPYEGAVHVPLVFAWPDGTDAEAGERTELAELRDIFPTLAHAVGPSEAETLEIAELDGQDLACAFGSLGAGCTRNVIGLEHDGGMEPHNWNALIMGSKKYISFASGQEQLFDLEADPQESRDLAADPGSARELARFRQELAAQFSAEGRGENFLVRGKLRRGRQPLRFTKNYPSLSLLMRNASFVHGDSFEQPPPRKHFLQLTNARTRLRKFSRNRRGARKLRR